MSLRDRADLAVPRAPQDFPDSPLSRAFRQPLMLGVFLPLQTGGWSQSTLPRGTDWTFDYNLELTRRAEALGFDIAFGLSQWLPKGGFGGASHYRENFLDPFVSAVALSSATRSILLLGTIHALYGPWHPLHLAKFLATADHVSGGRFGANIVTGYADMEPAMFGLTRPEHDRRYAMADEFVAVAEDLWAGEDNLTFEGEHWSLREAYVSPRPAFGRPVLVSAGGSPAGFAFAGRHSDIVFISSPAGEDITDALAALPAHVRAVKDAARAQGREVRVVINPTVVSRPTSAEAHAYYRAIQAHADLESIAAFQSRHAAGDSRSWLEHSARGRAVGGHLHVVGSPEEVTGQLAALHATGIDGVQLTFYDYLPDLGHFGEEILPLLEQAGLRLPVPPDGGPHAAPVAAATRAPRGGGAS
ncbi:LLM class flavin-dependent oxidoreductase [Streptomyces fuscigenes]|uniref:LLM class flavin-dependent oxidoreductase n=1 Tax=Streptomyces fuscigenes TaxID=1528880 RepID=UPI001F4100E3|nr:LLM class flavin-dependent oxidoreductase [Streptomyces fuscigenes]MCF3960143.1 LLM class flavin-dependent oxidoreductase [Streptomyces fuscigenes]